MRKRRKGHSWFWSCCALWTGGQEAKRSCQEKYNSVPRWFSFRIDQGGKYQLEVAICDLKLGWSPISAICIYRAGSGHAFQRVELRKGHQSQYRDHTDFCTAKKIPWNEQRTCPENWRVGKECIRAWFNHTADLRNNQAIDGKEGWAPGTYWV